MGLLHRLTNEGRSGIVGVFGANRGIGRIGGENRYDVLMGSVDVVRKGNRREVRKREP
jgi:hypothetical protein